MAAGADEAPPSTPPAPVSKRELLKFSYAEVLDATKHQDDKVGRLLGAVAFLTGGALVFANTEVLEVHFLVGGRSYPLGAVTLGAFILIDLVAVAVYLLAMAAPLTMPRRPKQGPESVTHIFFRGIAPLNDREWGEQWHTERLVNLDDELVGEIKNIAERADQKYGRTAIATSLFLAALVVLAPTVVLGLAASGKGTNALPWDTTVRWCVAISVVLVVGALLAPLAFTAFDGRNLGVPLWFTLLAVVYTALIGSLIVADGSTSGAWAIAVLGVLAAVLSLATYPTHRIRGTLHAAAILAVAAVGIVAGHDGRSDVQLFTALAAGVAVVVPNIIDEIRHQQLRHSAEKRACPPA
jgi:hypothetical protein